MNVLSKDTEQVWCYLVCHISDEDGCCPSHAIRDCVNGFYQLSDAIEEAASLVTDGRWSGSLHELCFTDIDGGLAIQQLGSSWRRGNVMCVCSIKVQRRRQVFYAYPTAASEAVEN